MWLAVNDDNMGGSEVAFLTKPVRKKSFYEYGLWVDKMGSNGMPIEDGTIKKLTGKRISWDSEPIECCNLDLEHLVLLHTELCAHTRCMLVSTYLRNLYTKEFVEE